MYLAIVASLVTVLGGAWLYAPTILIQPGTVLNSADPQSAEFVISNTGRVPVYDLIFRCRIRARNFDVVLEGNTEGSPFGGTVGQLLAKLSPGDSATRDCRQRIVLKNLTFPVLFDFTVTYTWPLVGWSGLVTRRFTTRNDADGHAYIVPDTL